jgi:hypothetical protein
MDTVSKQHVTMRMEQDRWVLSISTDANRGGTIRLFVDHHFGKEDDFTGEVVNYDFLPEPIRFAVISEQEAEARFLEAEEHGDTEYAVFTPHTAATITGLPVESIVADMIERWKALQFIMTPGIATSH